MGICMFLRKGSVHTKPRQPLPEGYTELEYIQSSGAQYINSGFVPNQDTKIIMKAEWTPAASGSTFLFGGSSGSKTLAFEFGGYTGRYRAMYDGTETFFTSTAFDQPMSIVADKNTTTINGSETVSATYSAFDAGYPVFICATNRAGNAYGVHESKVYSCQIYDNGNLVRDFVPVMDGSGVVGLYDRVNDVFYTNAGSGTFTAGPEVA